MQKSLLRQKPVADLIAAIKISSCQQRIKSGKPRKTTGKQLFPCYNQKNFLWKIYQLRLNISISLQIIIQ